VKECSIFQECGGKNGVGILLKSFRHSKPKRVFGLINGMMGQHCWWVHEQLHPIWSQDPQYFSRKYGKAGLNYKLAILLFKSQVDSMKGPYTAGANDLKVFIMKGLEQQLLVDCIKAIGDGGYHGHQKSISAPNPNDSAGVRLFKS
jgi:hypothetical protein